MSTNTTITLKLTGQQEEQLLHAFSSFKTETPAFARFRLRPDHCVITCYTSGKTVFQGKDAAVYASPFLKEKTSKNIFPQAGSDEVGTGDYFGPVCVCAAIVKENDLALLKELGVRDSKQVNDALIRKSGPVLLEKLPHSLLILNSRKYNEVHQKYNMNAIKAMLHNQAYVNLSRKVPLPDFRVVDQFAPEKTYYGYLKNVEVVIDGIHFETKSEDKYPAVGAASILARYAFLVKMDELDQKYGMHFEKGASASVDRCAREFISRYGREALTDVAKLHFANTSRL